MTDQRRPRNRTWVERFSEVKAFVLQLVRKLSRLLTFDRTKDRIEAKEIVLKDDSGRCRIRLSAKSEHPEIEVFDSREVKRIRIGFSELQNAEGIDNPLIELMNREGNWVVDIGVDAVEEWTRTADGDQALRYDNPHIYLATRSDIRSLSAIDLMVHGTEPMLLVTRANQNDKHALTINERGEIEIKANPFD